MFFIFCSKPHSFRAHLSSIILLVYYSIFFFSFFFFLFFFFSFFFFFFGNKKKPNQIKKRKEKEKKEKKRKEKKRKEKKRKEKKKRKKKQKKKKQKKKKKMPIVGNSDEDRAVAHYKQATRYDKENKPAKSRAHLRRALDYLSFGMHDQPYDLEKPAYVKPYDPEYPALGKFEDTEAYVSAYKELYDRESVTYYKMRNPPIHADFVHPLVNVWVEEGSGFVNVYADIDTEADTYSEACELVDARHMPIMETIEIPKTFSVKRADGTYATCVAFTREFMHGLYLCFVFGGENHGDRITIEAPSTDRTELSECDWSATSMLVGVEKRRRKIWTRDKMYSLDFEGYRNSTGFNVHPPLVNVWRLSPDSRTLTNIYIRDERQRDMNKKTNQRESIKLEVDSAYPFLSRVDTTREQVAIANLVELDALRRQEVDHNHTTVLYMKKFLNDPEHMNGTELVMPPFCVFYTHEFGRGMWGGRIVTLVNIDWCNGAAEQVTLLGERVRSNGVRMVRVFTTEDEFLSAHLGEIHEQEKSIKYAKQEREAEKRHRQQQEELDKKDYIGYIGDTLVPTSEILGKKAKTKRKRP